MEIPKTKTRSWISLPMILVMMAAIIGCCGLAGWVLFRQKADIFQGREKFPLVAEAEIDSAIIAGVKLDAKVTGAYIRKNLLITQFRSGEKLYTVFKVVAPETCGKAGCLHVVQTKDSLPILLQLLEMGVGKEVFRPSATLGCFLVAQPEYGETKDYEVCEK
jgi:hypothetical protein